MASLIQDVLKINGERKMCNGKYKIYTCRDRKEWLQKRLEGIGASEASIALGYNPYMTNAELWRIKTGKDTAEDISNNKNVMYGTKAESALRKIFILDYPEYAVTYNEFRILTSVEFPIMSATLDGEIYDTKAGTHGVLEIKTCEIRNSSGWNLWENQIPQQYYCQLLHQLVVTGYDFAILKVQLKYSDYGSVRHDTRHYRLDADDEKVQEDIEALIEREYQFWQYVQDNKQPPLILPRI